MVVSFVLLLLLGVGHLDLMLVVAALTLGDLFVFGRFCVAKVFWKGTGSKDRCVVGH